MAEPRQLIADYAWTLVTYDISAVADNQPAVYLRWGMGPTDSSVTFPGWNIDDVSVTGIRREKAITTVSTWRPANRPRWR